MVRDFSAAQVDLWSIDILDQTPSWGYDVVNQFVVCGIQRSLTQLNNGGSKVSDRIRTIFGPSSLRNVPGTEHVWIRRFLTIYAPDLSVASP